MSLDPFLPESEIVPAAAPDKRNPKKTLLLWVILIVLFLTIWQFLTPAEKKTPSAIDDDRPRTEAVAAPCPDSGPRWASFGAVLLPVAAIVFLLRRFTKVSQLQTHFYSTQEPGTLALARGRFPEAVRLFRDTLPSFAKQPMARAVVQLNVANALEHDGKLDEALAMYAEVERANLWPYGSGIRAQVASHAAFVYALKGDTQTAKRWTTDLRRRLAKSAEERTMQGAHLALAEATTLCREGAYADAVKLLDERWLEMRFAMRADAFRVAEIMRAFAEAQAGVRAANLVAERLVRIEPVTKGELAFLGVAWPEMQAFLAAHDL